MKYILIGLFSCCVIFVDAQELLHIVETNDARMINNNVLVRECNSCLDQDLLTIQFLDLENKNLSLIDEFVIDESIHDYAISSFEVSIDGKAVCVYLIQTDVNNPKEKRDKVICYNLIDDVWSETYRRENIDLSYHSNTNWVPWSNFEIELSSDGTFLYIAYTKIDDIPTGSITLEIMELNENNNSYTISQVLETNIHTNPGLTLSLINNDSTVLISPGVALGGYDNQFIQYNYLDSLWVMVDPEFGQQKLRIPSSVVSQNKSGNLTAYVSYDGIEQPDWNPNIVFDTLINGNWSRMKNSYQTANTSIVESISIADNGNIVAMGYTNQIPNYNNTDSLGFVDLIIRRSSNIYRVHRFTYNEQISNAEFSHPYFVQLSSDGKLIMINNDANQRLIYNISELISDFNSRKEQSSLIPIKLFPNPTYGQLQSENIDYYKVRVFNSIGQVTGEYAELQDLDLVNYSPGLYTLIFYDKVKPMYLGEIIKL